LRPGAFPSGKQFTTEEYISTMSDIQQRDSVKTVQNIARALTAVVFAAGLTIAAPVQAEQPAQAPQGAPHSLSPEQQKLIQAFQPKHVEMMQIQRQLGQIQDKTMKAHPELQKQQEQFADMLKTKMKKNGHSPDKEMADLRGLVKQLQDKSTPDDKRRKLALEFQQKRQAFEKAQEQAMEDKDVQQARGQLMTAIITAMKKDDPKTQGLIKQLDQKRAELMKIRQEATQSK
jgi:hypothetical protein